VSAVAVLAQATGLPLVLVTDQPALLISWSLHESCDEDIASQAAVSILLPRLAALLPAPEDVGMEEKLKKSLLDWSSLASTVEPDATVPPKFVGVSSACNEELPLTPLLLGPAAVCAALVLLATNSDELLPAVS